MISVAAAQAKTFATIVYHKVIPVIAAGIAIAWAMVKACTM